MSENKLRYFTNFIKQIFITKKNEDIILYILWIVGIILMICLFVDFQNNITPIAILLSAFMASVAMIKSINENLNLNKQKKEQEKLQSNDFFLFQVFIFYKIFINKNNTTNELQQSIIELHNSINNEKIIFNLNKNIISSFFNLVKETSNLKDEINQSISRNSNNENNIFEIRDYFNKVILQSINSIKKDYLSMYGDELSSNHLFISEEYDKSIF
jgi:MFS superfamily sulfate permease-like transporter